MQVPHHTIALSDAFDPHTHTLSSVLLQVSSVQATLLDMRLDLSSSRVAGCFMLTNLRELQQQLLTVQGQLQATAQHECCYGVQQQLARAQQLQQDMLGTVQVSIGTPLT
jgi:hypothetical protein